MSDWKQPEWMERFGTGEPAPKPRTASSPPEPESEPAPPASEATYASSGEVAGLESALSSAIRDPDPEVDDEPKGTGGPLSPLQLQVQELLRNLAKAVKTVQLYPIENPLCRQFAERLQTGFESLFEEVDGIRLAVGKTRLYYGGEPVLEQEGRDESIPGRLFWDGVREISLHRGLSPEETLTFLSLFRRAPRSRTDGEDDFVTLLWDSKFEHLTYIAVDDILDLDNDDDPIPEEFGTDFMNFIDLDMHNLEDEEGMESQASEMARQIASKMKEEEDPELFGISAQELDELKEEIELEDSPRMLQDIVHILGETLFHERDTQTFVELVLVLNEAMLAFLDEGRVWEAAEVLALLRDVGTRGDLDPQMREPLAAGVAAAFDGQRIEILATHLEALGAGVSSGVTEFVTQLPAESLPALCEILVRIENPRSKRELIDSLVRKAEGDIKPFLPFLRDPRPEAIRSVIEILGALKSDLAVRPLTQLARHSDYLVRRDALSSLGELGKARALDVLAEAIFDPDARIRVAAARGLARAGRAALPFLIHLIEDPDFDKRDLGEKRAIYEALGFAGKFQVLPLLEKTLKRKGFFRRSNVDEIRACACEALGWIGGARALDLLEGPMHDRSVLVRTAAQSARRRIDEGLNEEFFLKEVA